MACWRGLCKACRSLIRPRTTALPARAVSSGTLRQRYTLETKLGAGAFGTVWRALRRADGLPFAVKMIPRSKHPDLHWLQREIEIMKALDHPHVLKLHEVFEDERFVYLVVELCTGGEVLDRILELGYFTERLAARLMAHLLEAINHVHERGIAHRDLKLENCLLSGRLEDADLKLA
ncbi:unnamed protein product, partial [Effrenium voratum]